MSVCRERERERKLQRGSSVSMSGSRTLGEVSSVLLSLLCSAVSAAFGPVSLADGD